MYKISITGKMNTGKDTLSKILVKEIRTQYPYPHQWASYLAFADPIKEMARIMYPQVPKKFFLGSSKYRSEIIPGAFKDGQPLTVRQILKDIGTQGREYQDNVWLNIFDMRFAKISGSGIVIVSDARFRNELDHLTKKGFYTIRLYRQTNQPTDTHISETDQDGIPDSDFDYVIHNDKGLKDLKQEVALKIVPYLKP
jgi:hypothetical protein